MKKKIVEWSWDNEDSQDSFMQLIGFSDLEQASHEIGKIEKLIGLTPCNCLDFGCGNGRHSIALANKGYRVKGIDISNKFLNQAKSNAKGLNLDIDFMQSRGSELVDINTYDFILAYNHSIGFMAKEEINKHFKCIYNSLKSGGRFFLITAGPKITSHTTNQHANSWVQKGNQYILTDKVILDGYRLEKCIVIDMDKDEITQYNEKQQAFSLSDYIEILSSAGFNQIEAYDSIDGINATEDSFGAFYCVKV